MQGEFTTYVLALEVEPMAVGQAYDQLPMYCTIMPRFHSPLNPDELAAGLEPVLKKHQSVDLIPKDHCAFGPKKQLVTIVEPTKAITALHNDLLEILNELNVHYTEREWVGEGYIAHVTDKKGERLAERQTVTSGTVYLISVEHPLEGRRRFVHRSFSLG